MDSSVHLLVPLLKKPLISAALRYCSSESYLSCPIRIIDMGDDSSVMSGLD